MSARSRRRCASKGEQVGHVTTAEYGSQMLSLGGVHHLTGGSKKEGVVTCETLLTLCNKGAVEMTRRRRRHAHRAGRPAAGHQRRGRGAHARRLRLGHHRHLRQAMARPCRRGHRRRRPHHRRADRASGRPLPRHAARRHPRARPANRRPAAISRSPIPAPAGAAPTSPIRSTIIEKIDPKTAWPGLRLLMVSTTGEHAAWFVLDEDLKPQPAEMPPAIASRWSSASARIASRRSARCCSWPAPAAACAPASPRIRCG